MAWAWGWLLLGLLGQGLGLLVKARALSAPVQLWALWALALPALEQALQQQRCLERNSGENFAAKTKNLEQILLRWPTLLALPFEMLRSAGEPSALPEVP